VKKLLGLVTVMLLVGAICAQAGTVTLTFEGLQNNEQVLSYYNGGLGGNGSGPGPNYGITFGPDSLTIISGLNGGSGNFSGAPTMPTTLYFLSGPGDVMDVPAGFTTGFSFYYSAVVYPGSVSVFDGLDGTGSLLASIILPVTPSGGSPECTYGAYCPWFPIGVTFSGTAQSVVFSGSADYIGFDNVTLGSGIPTPGTPEPGTLIMFGSGVLSLAAVIRRKINR
jgi:PEP-CTERM motif